MGLPLYAGRDHLQAAAKVHLHSGLMYTRGRIRSPPSSLSFPHTQVVAVQLLSHVRLFATPWTAARQASQYVALSQSLLRLMCTKSVLPRLSLHFQASQYVAVSQSLLRLMCTESVLPRLSLHFQASQWLGLSQVSINLHTWSTPAKACPTPPCSLGIVG